VYFTGEDNFNPTKFQGISAGDTLRISGDTADCTGNERTHAVDRVDGENSHTSSIFFKTGSKFVPSLVPSSSDGPKMYPMITVNNGFVGGKLASQSLSNLYMAPTAIIQHVRTSNYAVAAPDVERVLEELPNRVLDNVAVTRTSAGLELYAYTVSFDPAQGSSGDQHSVIMNVDGCNIDGCQPRYSGVSTQLGVYADQDAQLTVLNAGASTTEALVNGGTRLAA
jgi:hypothetical protein